MKNFGILTVVLVAIALIFVGPFLVIWSLNTLFPSLAIEFSIWTWLAVVILTGAIRANVTVTKK